MKLVALLLPFTAAGASLSVAQSGVGAVSPTAAIEQFLAAVQRKDLKAMAAVWGTDRGPASKSMGTKELERREFIMIQCLGHEKATLGKPAPGEASRLKIPVELSADTRKAAPIFTVVQGPKKRWFVENLELDKLRDQGFCSAPPLSPRPR